MPLDDDEISRRLNGMRVIEPPGVLRASILEVIRGLGPRASGLGPARPQFGQPRTSRYVFAAGWAAAAALVLVFLVVQPKHRDSRDVAGTMAPNWPVVERIANDQATLLVLRRGDFYALEAVIKGARPVTASIAWDEKTLAPTGVSLGFDASFRKDQVTFTLRNPQQRAGVIVRRLGGATTADVRVSIGTQEVLRAAVPLD